MIRPRLAPAWSVSLRRSTTSSGCTRLWAIGRLQSSSRPCWHKSTQKVLECRSSPSPPFGGQFLEGSKGALYRETLQATGFYVGRIVIATVGFAPMPPFRLPGYPGGIIPTAIGWVFKAWRNLSIRCGISKTQTRAEHRLPPVSGFGPENAPGGTRSRPSS